MVTVPSCSDGLRSSNLLARLHASRVPYDLMWVCPANALTDLAATRGAPRTDDDLAASLTLAARHLVGEWP